MDEQEMFREFEQKRAAKKLKQQQEKVALEQFKALAVKKCGKCGLGAPQVGFAKHYRAKDGLQGWCRDCLAEASKLGGKPKGSISKDVIERYVEKLVKDLRAELTAARSA